jgi:signal transduction histidine kinase
MARVESARPEGRERTSGAYLSSAPTSDRPRLSIEELERQRTRLEERLSELQRVHARMLHTQKLEAIGHLAAGIAHEINTPTQYVTDNVEFLSRAFEQLADLISVSRALCEGAAIGGLTKDLVERAAQCLSSTRIAYILEEAPTALEQSVEGLRRIANIVSAMKNFSHPSAGEKAFTDLNESIESTVVVATNEWKYVADIETKLDPELPHVWCLRDEINQVVLNLIVNAAHAIDAVVLDGVKGKGTITITTKCVDEWVELRISDTGCGIPERDRARVFDPFFTTKPVGRGTGQGLAIAHSVIVDQHDGEIVFETEEGQGTTFLVRIPIGGPPPVSPSPFPPEGVFA